MAGVHELADGRPVGGANAFGGMNGAFDFADDVAGPVENDLIHLAPGVFQHLGGRIPERRHAENFRGRFTLFAARGIFAAGQLVFHVGVDDEHGDGGIGHRHQFRLPRTAIEEQDAVFLAQDGNELVHDAARHAGEFVLGLLAQQRLFDRIQFPAGDDFEQGGHGHFEGGAAGKTTAQRHGRVNQRIETAGIQSAD